MDDPTIKDFESALAELETIVKTLEDGQLTLEKSLEHFERGITLSRYCHDRLADAEQRVEILNERGEPRPAPAAIAGAHAPPSDPQQEKRGGVELAGSAPSPPAEDDVPF